MEIRKLKASDFNHTKSEFRYSIDDRRPENEGELIHSFVYTSTCKVFGKNVNLRITFWNPKESFDESLIHIKKELLWLEENRNKILSTMTTQRSADDFNKHLFNSDQTRNMNDEKFKKFLTLSEVRMKDNSIDLKFNEYDNIPGTYIHFDISADRKNMYLSSGG